MSVSLVYRVKRRRLLGLMMLVLGLVVAGSIWGPSIELAGPVWAERAGDGVALVLKEPRDTYRISYLRDGAWTETPPFTGSVRATFGGDSLTVVHGRDITTYKPGEKGKPMERAAWEAFPHHWTISAAAEGWVFGLLDDRTLAAARRGPDGAWLQLAGEVRRSSTVGDLCAAARGGEAWIWWREDAGVFGSRASVDGWHTPQALLAPEDARLAAASVAGVPTLLAFTGLRRHNIRVAAFPADGAPWETSIRNEAELLSAVDALSVADGDPAHLTVARGFAAGYATFSRVAPTELAALPETVMRTRQDVLIWISTLIFASFSIVGIGFTLLFERRNVTNDVLLDQARLLVSLAPLPARVLAASVDITPFFILGGVVAGSSPDLAVLAFFGGPVLYHALFEFLGGATPGKRLLGLRVRNLDGSPPPAWKIVVRSVLLVLDLMMLPAAICMVSTTRTQRLGDLFARTMVVRIAAADAPDESGEEAP